MKNVAYLLMVIFLSLTSIANAQKEKEYTIKIVLDKSNDNVSVSIDTTITKISCHDINVDSIMNSMIGEMEKFDKYFSMDFDSILNQKFTWIEDSLDDPKIIKKVEKCISNNINKGDIDSIMSANMIFIKSAIDSTCGEKLMSIEITLDSLDWFDEDTFTKFFDSVGFEGDFNLKIDSLFPENIEKYIYFLSGDEDEFVFNDDKNNNHVIKKIVKNNEDSEDIEVTYDISGEEENGIQKIVIVDDGKSKGNFRKHKIFNMEEDKFSFEMFNLSDKEKSVYGEQMDIKGKEKLNPENLLIYPNPNNGKFRLSFELEKNDQVTLTIFNSKGKKIMEKEMQGSKGKFSSDISLKLFDTGDLIMKITQGKKFKVKRLYIK